MRMNGMSYTHKMLNNNIQRDKKRNRRKRRRDSRGNGNQIKEKKRKEKLLFSFDRSICYLIIVAGDNAFTTIFRTTKVTIR